MAAKPESVVVLERLKLARFFSWLSSKRDLDSPPWAEKPTPRLVAWWKNPKKKAQKGEKQDL